MNKYKELINKNNNTYEMVKVWNEDGYNKQNRLDYWGKFERYFKQGINKIDCRENDFSDYVSYLCNNSYENNELWV